MSQLDIDARTAMMLGISYGTYKAMTYDPEKAMVDTQRKNRKRKQRKYTDEEAFQLWQDGMSDAKIGSLVGVSRQCIQRWRDQMELPATAKFDIDTKKYRLAVLQDGSTVAIHEDDEL